MQSTPLIWTLGEPQKVSVYIKRVEFRQTVRAFFPQGIGKLSVITRCTYYEGVCKARFDCRTAHETLDPIAVSSSLATTCLLHSPKGLVHLNANISFGLMVPLISKIERRYC